jgi:hypothetical protein
MKRSFPIILVALCVLALALFAWPTMYIHYTNGGTVWRVNRLSGVQERASRWGWVTQKDLEQRLKAEFAAEAKAEGMALHATTGGDH